MPTNTTSPSTDASIAAMVADVLAPRRCAACGRRLPLGVDAVCPSCNIRLPRTGHSANAAGNEMARLFWGRMPIERAAAMFFYEPHSLSANVVYALKYGDRPGIGLAMGRIAAAEMAADGFFEGIDVVLPVPLSRQRERQRGYNQSLEIARGVAEVAKVELSTAAARLRHTDVQAKLDNSQRASNVEGAFGIADPEAFAGRHVLIVDDVVTTGATVCSLGMELAKIPGVRLSMMSLGFTKH